jgi:hypothetical protein
MRSNSRLIGQGIAIFVFAVLTTLGAYRLADAQSAPTISNPTATITNCVGSPVTSCQVNWNGLLNVSGGTGTGGSPPPAGGYVFDKAANTANLLSFPISTSGPNELVFVFSVFQGATSCAISDTSGLTWTPVISKVASNECAWVAKAPTALSADTITVTAPGNLYNFNAWAAFSGGAQTHDTNSSVPASSFGKSVMVSPNGATGLAIGLVNPSVGGAASFVPDTGFTNATTTGPLNPLSVEYQIFSTKPASLTIGANGGNSVGAVMADIWD